MINGRAASGFGLPKTQTCYPPVGIVYNPMPLPFLSGSTVLLTDENSLPNCSLNHSPISCPLMESASLDIEQRLAADERGGLPFVEADFKAELLHVHQFLE